VSASKRPSTSSLRRFITSRPYVPVAELRRRFGLDEPDAMTHLRRNGTAAWIGLPEREATKIQELWDRGELGVELSVEVRAPVVVGLYPMHMARYVIENGTSPGSAQQGNGNGRSGEHPERSNGPVERPRRPWYRRAEPEHPREHRTPRPMSGAPSYGSPAQELPRD
jgi:hypothetical protein